MLLEGCVFSVLFNILCLKGILYVGIVLWMLSFFPLFFTLMDGRGELV